MFKHILVATDGSLLSERAIAKAVELAKICGAKLTGITVSEPFNIVAVDAAIRVNEDEDAYRAEAEKRAARLLRVVQDTAAAADVPANVIHRYAEHPYEAIIDAANAESCDGICMASHGRGGIQALVLGSETTKVLTHSQIPVIVLR